MARARHFSHGRGGARRALGGDDERERGGVSLGVHRVRLQHLGRHDDERQQFAVLHLGPEFLGARGVGDGVHLHLERGQHGRGLRSRGGAQRLEFRVAAEHLLHVLRHLLGGQFRACELRHASARIDEGHRAGDRCHLHANQHADGGDGAEHEDRHHQGAEDEALGEDGVAHLAERHGPDLAHGAVVASLSHCPTPRWRASPRRQAPRTRRRAWSS